MEQYKSHHRQFACFIPSPERALKDILNVFVHCASPKKLKYGKPGLARLGESTLTKIIPDTPNLAQITFFVLLGGGPVKSTHYKCKIFAKANMCSTINQRICMKEILRVKLISVERFF